MTIDAPRPHHLSGLQHLWRTAFGDTDAFIRHFFATAYAPTRAMCLTEGDAPRAALYWFDCLCGDKPLAYLYAIATDADYRGRGYCRSLMEQTHRHLAARGYAGAMLVPADESLFALYARLGYTVCTEICELTAHAEGTPLPLCRLSAEEYLRLRVARLPKGGVVQAEGLAAFLDGQASFVQAEDTLLAYRIEKEKLFGMELLGDISLAPTLLSALGAREGRFRTPGRGRPFAMYLPLGGAHSVSPSYFGLALD